MCLGIEVSSTTILIATIALIAIALLFRFNSRAKIVLRGLGFSFSAEGQNNPSPSLGKTSTPKGSHGDTVIASGERAAAIAGDLKGNITTGDQIRK
jgi:hypothetical protein